MRKMYSAWVGVKQLHPGRLRRAPGLVVVAANAGGDHVGPLVPAPKADRAHVVARQLAMGESPAAIHAEVVVTLEQGAVGQGRGVIVLALGDRVMGAVGGDDGVDRERAAPFGQRVDSAPQQEQGISAGIGDLSQEIKPGGAPVIHPLERHSGQIGSQYLLAELHHGWVAPGGMPAGRSVPPREKATAQAGACSGWRE